MSYYILPKNINYINVNPQSSYDLCSPYVSYSMLNYYYETKQQINDMFSSDGDLSDNCFDKAAKIINPCEFIFSKVPGSKFSVSKLKPKTNIFYDLLEISSNLNIFEQIKNDYSNNFLHITPNYNDSIECFEIFREDYRDNHIFLNNIPLGVESDLFNTKFDFIFYETDSSNYFTTFIQSLLIILSQQKYNGNCIIKVSDIFHKPCLDILYFLSSLYDKVYISKPSTNNITSFDRYIICKNFLHNESSNLYLKLNYIRLIIFLKKLDNKNIISLFDFDLPYFFKNKIDDINIIIGQQQLEALDQIISLFKNKNRDEKIENIKKNNIQKSVLWCEKYKIPFNKFTEKINIFLPIVNES